MVSRKEEMLMRRMYAVVKKHGVVDRTLLQSECGKMSIIKYNSIKAYFEEAYDNKVEYRKIGKARLWIDTNPNTEQDRESIQKVLEQYISQ